MVGIEINPEDAILCADALGLWANHVETGDIGLSREDLPNKSMPGRAEAVEHYVRLTPEQIALVARLRDLGNRFRGGL